VHCCRRAVERGGHERGDDAAARTLARPVDGGEREHCELETVGLAVVRDDVDDRLRCGASQAVRHERRFLHGQFACARPGVDVGRRNGDDDLVDTGVTRCRAHGDDRGERLGCSPRIVFTGNQEREVEHDARATQREHGDAVGACGVDVVELQRSARAPGVCEVGDRAGLERVEDVDGPALGEQRIDEVRPDETGTTDDGDRSMRVAVAGVRHQLTRPARARGRR